MVLCGEGNDVAGVETLTPQGAPKSYETGAIGTRCQRGVSCYPVYVVLSVAGPGDC